MPGVADTAVKAGKSQRKIWINIMVVGKTWLRLNI